MNSSTKDLKGNKYTSVVFNKDLITKYNYDRNIMPLRSYLYLDNTGLADEELFKRYKAYQKAKKGGMKIEKPEIMEDVLLVVEFRRILGENPYKYISSGRFFYEYEVINVLIDKYDFS